MDENKQFGEQTVETANEAAETVTEAAEAAAEAVEETAEAVTGAADGVGASFAQPRQLSARNDASRRMRIRFVIKTFFL